MRADGRWVPPGPCRHCRQRPIQKARRLCERCYYDETVRPLYPAMTPQHAGRLGGRVRAKGKR